MCEGHALHSNSAGRRAEEMDAAAERLAPAPSINRRGTQWCPNRRGAAVTCHRLSTTVRLAPEPPS